MSSPDPQPIAHERLERGLAMYHKVYGENAITMENVEFFDLMMAHLFAEIWDRPALDIDQRRLLVMGVLAAQGKFETLGFQFTRCLEAGQFDEVQVREVVLQLIPYVGYPSSGDLYRAAEVAIATHKGGAQ